jgi:hypothetical protein
MNNYFDDHQRWLALSSLEHGLAEMGSHGDICAKVLNFWIVCLLTVHKGPNLAATSGYFQAYLSGLVVS